MQFCVCVCVYLIFPTYQISERNYGDCAARTINTFNTERKKGDNCVLDILSNCMLLYILDQNN